MEPRAGGGGCGDGRLGTLQSKTEPTAAAAGAAAASVADAVPLFILRASYGGPHRHMPMTGVSVSLYLCSTGRPPLRARARGYGVCNANRGTGRIASPLHQEEYQSDFAVPSLRFRS